MKKTCLIVLTVLSLVLFASVFTACKSTDVGTNGERPLWADINTIEQVFSSEKYVTGIGKAAAPDVAQNLADGNLASYFSREISSEVSAQQIVSNYSGSSGINSDKKQEELIRNVTVKSDVALAGICHTDPWFDKQLKQYICCSYLDRKQAWENYESTADQEKKKFYSFLDAANSSSLSSDPLKRIETLKKAKEEGENYQKVILFSELLYRKGCVSYSADRDVLSSIDQKIADVAMNVKMNVVFQNLTDKNDAQYKPVIEKIITDCGFKVSSDAHYSVLVSINKNKEKMDDVVIAIPEVNIEIKNSKTSYLSYKEVLDKVSVFSEAEKLLDSKINKAIEKSLKDGFASELAKLKAN